MGKPKPREVKEIFSGHIVSKGGSQDADPGRLAPGAQLLSALCVDVISLDTKPLGAWTLARVGWGPPQTPFIQSTKWIESSCAPSTGDTAVNQTDSPCPQGAVVHDRHVTV